MGHVGWRPWGEDHASTHCVAPRCEATGLVVAAKGAAVAAFVALFISEWMSTHTTLAKNRRSDSLQPGAVSVASIKYWNGCFI